ncbi:MAG: phage holin family protein [Chloroflexi bacterium]|nr:phage holin family protein [Chloroflexota bacterium]
MRRRRPRAGEGRSVPGRVVTVRYEGPDRSPTGLVARLCVNGVGLIAAGAIIPGVAVSDWQSVVAGAALLALVDALLKPLVAAASCCLIVLSFGLFLVVVNAAMLAVTAWISGQLGLNLRVDGFWSAAGGALVISLVSLAAQPLLSRITRRAPER